MYRAKDVGRNRVVTWDPDASVESQNTAA
jgi:hypothetical protein